MSPEKKSYLTLGEVVEKSIEFELDSAGFYRDMRSSTREPRALELLEMLETQETGHAETLRSIPAKADLDAVFVQFPPDLVLAMPAAPPPGTGFSALLDLAIEREVRSAEIYRASGLTAPAPIRTLLQSLAEFELVHERSLRELKLA